MRRALLALAIAVGLFMAGAGGAVAGSLVTSADIQDFTIRQVDVNDRVFNALRDGRQANNRAERLRQDVRFLQSQVDGLQRRLQDAEATLCRNAGLGTAQVGRDDVPVGDGTVQRGQVFVPRTIDDGFGAARNNRVWQECEFLLEE